MTHDPRLDEPGWIDRLVGDETLWDGEDKLILSSDIARAVWGAVLCDYLERQENGARAVNECAGRLGWFHLRLTKEECRNLFAACKDLELIDEASDLHDRKSNEPEDLPYRRTEAGRALTAPRGAGIVDTAKRAPEVVAKTFKLANGVLGASVFTALLSLVISPLLRAIGIDVSDTAAVAWTVIIASGWLLILAFVIGAYSDEKALRACAPWQAGPSRSACS